MGLKENQKGNHNFLLLFWWGGGPLEKEAPMIILAHEAQKDKHTPAPPTFSVFSHVQNPKWSDGRRKESERAGIGWVTF